MQQCHAEHRAARPGAEHIRDMSAGPAGHLRIGGLQRLYQEQAVEALVVPIPVSL